ncbi:unnamed protein product [Periconia digitata]|uniref:Uncharacterized protein n=1 Tax=Periconia digitata TaxID=1303443 RepID=A0A9W4XQY0_9PLEO|nr:unnamed protein product [Periconia digitata]
MPSFQYTILPIQFNSQCITFPEWISLFTLCLAPLIAHIASGIPPVSYLSHTRPKWYDHLCHYNPTSIVWRYAVITDRRIRATQWSRDDLTASNAIFWTAKGWDGHEDMVVKAAQHKLRCPGLTHVQIMSVTMLKTIIVTTQGLSALYTLVASLAGVKSTNFMSHTTVDSIFLPLAILGLLRLCAAIWLTEDFVYTADGNMIVEAVHQRTRDKSIDNNPNTQVTISHSALEPFFVSPPQVRACFRSPSFWPSRIFRGTYLLIIGGIWGLSLLCIMPGIVSSDAQLTASAFSTGLFYFLFLSVSIGLYTLYFVRDQTTTTIIPCISATWYKIYTLLIMGFIVVLIVIGSIEASTIPYANSANTPSAVKTDCGFFLKEWTFVAPYSSFFGLASRAEGNAIGAQQNRSSLAVGKLSNALLEERYSIDNFTGYCIGEFGNS